MAPAYNCGSELDPLLHAGLTVVLYPVDRQTHVDIAAIEAYITSRTRAIYLIHYFGFLQPATPALRALCDARGLFLIEDCALSLLSGSNPANGTAGDISLYCFYKFFPVIGGGALVINNSHITSKPRFDKVPPLEKSGKALLRAGLEMVMGAERRSSMTRRLRPGRSGVVVPPVTGANLYPDMPSDYYFDNRFLDTRINSLTARQIKTYDISSTIGIRRSNYRAYLAAFADVPSIAPLFPQLPDDVCPLSMPILVENRNEWAAKLITQGIAATPWWAGYNRHLDFTGQSEACHLKDHVLSLPCHQYLGDAEIRYISAEIRNLGA